MNEVKFTPGPWYLDFNFDVCTEAETENISVCSVTSGGEYTQEEYDEWKANGYLIAAAPEMYELLDMIRKAVSFDAGILGSCLSKIEPLLKKARGEE